MRVSNICVSGPRKLGASFVQRVCILMDLGTSFDTNAANDSLMFSVGFVTVVYLQGATEEDADVFILDCAFIRFALVVWPEEDVTLVITLVFSTEEDSEHMNDSCL